MADREFHNDLRARMRSYVFASNWAEARRVVESDAWYRSDEAVETITRLAADAREISDGGIVTLTR